MKGVLFVSLVLLTSGPVASAQTRSSDTLCGGAATNYESSLGRVFPKQGSQMPGSPYGGQVRSLEAFAALIDSRGGDHIVGWMAFDDKAHPWVKLVPSALPDVQKLFFPTPESQKPFARGVYGPTFLLTSDLPSHLSLLACTAVERQGLHATK